MSLLQFLAILRARIRLIAGVFVGVLLLGALVTAVLPRMYTAAASVVIEARPDPLASALYAGGINPALMATQVDILRSERVALRVVRTLGLTENAEIRAQWDSGNQQGSIEQWMVGLINRSLDVVPARESSVINVTYKARDPRFAATMANAFVQAYLDTVLEMRVEPARQYSAFFNQRAKEAGEALERAQSALSGFQREKGIVANDERLDVENSRLNELSTQLVVLQAQASDSGSRQTAARGSAERMQEVLNNPLVAGLKADQARLESRLKELNARLGDNHPQVLEVLANLAELKKRIELETGKVAGSLGVTNSINQQRMGELKAQLEAQRAKVMQMKAVRDDGAVLVRDVENAQRTYDQISQRLNQSTMESLATQSNATLLARAEAPTSASSPKVTLNMALSVFSGLILGVLAAIGLELMDRRIRTAADLEDLMGVGLVGGVARHDTPAALVVAPAWREQGAWRSTADGSNGAPAMSSPLELAARAPTAIGDLIRVANNLSATQVEQVLAYQREHGVRFGEAAVALGLADAQDVLSALARQYQYPVGTAAQRASSPELVVLNQPFSAQAEAVRGVRSQLTLEAQRQGRRGVAVAILSAGRGDGRSYFAANLAISLAQLGGRTLLIDADLRQARQHQIFGLDNHAGLSTVLSGRSDALPLCAAPGIAGLELLPAGPTPPNPLELLERAALNGLWRTLGATFDHVVIDTAAASHGADACVVAAQAGEALLLARRNVTRAADLHELGQWLKRAQTSVVGTVLNSF